MSMNDEIATIEVERDSYLIITRENGHQQKYSGKWLRLNCRCEKCKSFSKPTNLLYNIKIMVAEIKDQVLSCLICNMDDNWDHEVKIPYEMILENCNCKLCIDTELISRNTKPRNPDKSPPYLKYSNNFTEKDLFRVLQKVIEHGFCIIQNFPTEETETTVEFVKSFGFIRSSLYDTFFRICSVKQPNTVALTSLEIKLHQDITIYESAPGVLTLLTQRFDETVKGGRSKVLDLHGCAEMLRKEHPEHFKTLCRIPAIFQTIRMNSLQTAWLKSTKPHIELDYFDQIVAVHWSPSIEGTLRIREKDIGAYYSARKAFTKILDDPKNQFLFRSQPGDLMLVNNLRMVHSREAFTSFEDGDRDMFGFFIEMDDVKSKYMTMAKKLSKTIVPPKIGGRSSF